MSHAKLSPSGGYRWFECPGSVRELAKIPERPSGKAAIDGTHSHTLLEHCLKGGGNPLEMIGIKLSDHEGEFSVDRERAKRVQVALDYIYERKTALKPCALHTEERVNPGASVGRDDIWGTADVQLIGETEIEVIDYKDGMAPVDPEENIQMLLYLVGALLPYWENPKGLPFTKFKLTIVQPKLVVKGMEPIRSWECDLIYVMSFVERLRKAAEATDDPNAPVVPGDKQCKWCDAKGNCPAYINMNMEGVNLNFDNLAQQSADKDPNALSDEQIREIVESAPSIRAMLEAVEKEAMRRFESGHNVGGLKVVRTSGRRQWNLDEEAMADRLRRMGIPKAEVYTQKLITPTQAEKLVWVNTKGDEKRLSDRQLKTLANEYVTKSQGGMKVVPEAEKGEAVMFDVSPMFTSVETNEIPDWMK